MDAHDTLLSTLRRHEDSSADADARVCAPFPKMNPHREAAMELYRSGGSDAVYSFLGCELNSTDIDEWKDVIESHLVRGKSITIEILQEASKLAWSAFRRKTNGGRRTMRWFYVALSEVINPAPSSEFADTGRTRPSMDDRRALLEKQYMEKYGNE